MPLRDEVNEPLGLWPEPEPRTAGKAVLATLSFVLPLLVAVAMGAFALGRHEVPPHNEQLAINAKAPPAPPRVEPQPVRAEPQPAAKSAAPPVAASDKARAASEAKAAGGPTPLIIDVQQALAAQRTKDAPFIQR